MEFLGIGPLELLFIVVIVIVVIGPKDIQKTMRSIGKGLNSIYKSEGWKAFNEVSRELRSLPGRLAQEAELEEVKKTTGEINQAIASVSSGLSAWTPDGKNSSPASPEPTIRPPAPAAASSTARPDAPETTAEAAALVESAPAELAQAQTDGPNGAQAPVPAKPVTPPAQPEAESSEVDGEQVAPNS